MAVNTYIPTLAHELLLQAERVAVQDPEYASLEELEDVLSHVQWAWAHTPALIKIGDPSDTWFAVVSASNIVFDRAAGTVTLTLDQPLPPLDHLHV